jgi:site-specific DNA-methyltransferase (adenine-specific)
MAVRIEDAGFEIRDMIAWVYGSGFPKSLDVSKAIDKATGAEREVVGSRVADDIRGEQHVIEITAPATPEAQQWAGWGTALKPALEPITMARKPLPGTVAANVLEHGTGALNVDGCRVGTETVSTHSRGSNGAFPKRPGETSAEESGRKQDQRAGLDQSERSGRWPANLIHDGSDEVVGLFPEANSARVGNPNNPHRGINHTATSYGQGDGKTTHDYRDTGSAARFFYCAKTSKRERGEGNNHPTVKPTALMQYLCRLVTPSGGTVLDPFMGSGSTGLAATAENFNFIGIERDPAYLDIARRRLGITL